MAFPYSGPNSNGELVAAQIDQLAGNAVTLTLAWRTSVNAGTAVDSRQAEAVYQALASLRAYVQANQGVQGLKEAYLRRFSTLPGGFNPATEWVPVNSAIVDFGSWFQGNWPERTAGNKPAFVQFNASTGVLEKLSVNLGASARTALVGYLDAILAALEAT